MKIKKNFPELSTKKIKELNKSIFNKTNKLKPKINMTTKEPSWKQFIVSISSNNTEKFMSALDDHVANLNYILKGIKSDTIVDFIWTDYRDLIITSNKVMSPSNISIINNYIKKCDNINVKDIQDAYLLQSKSYLKILSIPYLIERTNILIDSSVIELIIKSIHVFDNIKITSKPRVVKVFLKSDIAIV